MIDKLKVSFIYNNIQYTLSTPEDELNSPESIPYDIAEIVIQLIKLSDANSDIIIDSLIDNFGYEKETKQ
nr:MAG TPA: hypothetical protein [Caudoviricetes sp.]